MIRCTDSISGRRTFVYSRYSRSEIKTAPGVPMSHPFVELIGTIRRECLDHIIVLGEEHLCRILKNYADYYNGVRTHRSLNKDALKPPVAFPGFDVIAIRHPRVDRELAHRWLRSRLVGVEKIP